jgi:hypothetical protein
MPTPPVPDIPRRRQSEDTLLRSHQFVIKRRPKKGEPLWERQGKMYTHSEALKLVTKEVARGGKR